MDIKILKKTDYIEALNIKEKYHNKEISEISGELFDYNLELIFLKRWMEEECDDLRIALGAYEDDKLCGYIIGSFAEEEDSINGIEINYLFVDENRYKNGIGKSLIYRLCEIYFHEFKEDVVVYTHKELKSNDYYKSLGFTCIRNEKQGDLLVEVLKFNLSELLLKLNPFSFVEFSGLNNDTVKLVLKKRTSGSVEKGLVPAYFFDIEVKNTVVGHIDARIGFHMNLYYGGHSGYAIDEKFRGFGYASSALEILKEVFKTHNINIIHITCNPENFPSARTCEKAGAKYIKTIDVPEDNEMYKLGDKKKYLYRLDLN